MGLGCWAWHPHTIVEGRGGSTKLTMSSVLKCVARSEATKQVKQRLRGRGKRTFNL